MRPMSESKLTVTAAVKARIGMFMAILYHTTVRQATSTIKHAPKCAGWQLHVVEHGTRPSAVRETFQRLAPIGCIVERSMTLARNPILSLGGVPAVYLDQNPDTARPNTPMVVNDSAGFARLAAAEMLKSGLRNFTYIPYKTPASWC